LARPLLTLPNVIADPLLLQEWHAVARAAAVPENEPLGVELLGRGVVLWRSDAGIVAWEDLCIHRGAKLSLGKVANGCLSCPYHGWIYNAAGQCIRIPAHPEQAPPPRARAKTFFCQERYGLVWVALEEPAADVPDFPEWDQPGYRQFVRGPFRIKAQGPRIVENFLDLAHFFIVHPGLLGDADHAEIGRYNVTKTPAAVVASDIEMWQPDGAGTGEGAMVQYTYKVTHPLAAYLTKQAGDVRLTLMLATTPADDENTVAWLIMAISNVDHVPEESLYEYTDKIFLQDVPIVESQRPEWLPLDLQAELHLNSDRTSIAYRQWLRERGLVYGTA
jgi:phenylpropionate dioxygenase-like ring-hydroxylating dioxygenase large terminal subunit